MQDKVMKYITKKEIPAATSVFTALYFIDGLEHIFSTGRRLDLNIWILQLKSFHIIDRRLDPYMVLWFDSITPKTVGNIHAKDFVVLDCSHGELHPNYQITDNG